MCRIERSSPGTIIAATLSMRALVADDDPVTRAILTKTLRQWGMDVTVACDGADAWEALTSGPAPQMAILDWMMPGIDGVELCHRIRQEPALAGIYVILLTGRGSRSDLVVGLDSGADDYMVKPIDTEELRARVQVGIRVANLQGRLESRLIELESARDHLAKLVSTDTLTDLNSRRWWFELAATEFSRSRRYDRVFSLMVIDLDFFKRVNDTYGHDVGDKVLRRFAEILRFECRQSDIIGRLGGEEFALLATETPLAAAETVATRIREACRRLVVSTPLGDVTCSCSIGISELRPEDENIDGMLRRADAALYDAKRSGRDRWKTHDHAEAC